MARKTTRKRGGRKRAAGKKAARRGKAGEASRAATVAWAAGHLKKNPDITMSELARMGRKEGHHVYPLIIGLARRELGWASPRKKAARGGRKKAARGARAPRRGPGRPRRRAAGDPTDAIRQVVGRMQELERETARLRKAMDRIAEIAGSV